MSVRHRTVARLALFFIGLILLSPCFACAALVSYTTLETDRTVFIGTEHFQISALKHSDEANWDMVAEEYPPLYLGAMAIPGHCRLQEKNDLIFSLTGVWVALWSCSP